MRSGVWTCCGRILTWTSSSPSMRSGVWTCCGRILTWTSSSPSMRSGVWTCCGRILTWTSSSLWMRSGVWTCCARTLTHPPFDLDLLEAERRLDRLLDFPHFLLLDRLRDFFFPPHLLAALEFDLDLPFEHERALRLLQALLVSFSSASSVIALRARRRPEALLLSFSSAAASSAIALRGIIRFISKRICLIKKKKVVN